MILQSNFTMDNGRKKAIYKNVIVAFERVNNDTNGNPLYRVYPINFSFRHLKAAYRNYQPWGADSYYLLQSYNIETDIENLIESLFDQYGLSFPEIDRQFLEKYYEVKTLNDNKGAAE